MSDPSVASSRRIDAVAVSSVLRRLARAESPPWLHAEVARRMAERLAFIKLQPERVIDWWAFLGGSGEALSQACPNARRLAVEPTPQLLERTRSAGRAAWWSPRRWLGEPPEAVLDDQVAPATAQLLWANMMLHGVQDPPALLAQWERSLAPEGFVMFSCLGPDTVRELRELYARLGWSAPTIDFVDMHDLGDMLVHAGFADPVMDQETITLSWATPQDLLRELRSLGGNVSPDRFPALRTPRWRARLERELQTLAGADGRLALRFEIAYGHAFKSLTQVKQGQETTVSLDAMRALVKTSRRRS